MNCREFLARHSEYVDEVVESMTAARMRAHVAECAACARYDHVVRRGAALVRTVLPRIEVSEDFTQRVRHRLYHTRDEMAHRRAGAVSMYAAAASVLMVSFGAGALVLATQPAPVVDAEVVWVPAPPAMTTVASRAQAIPTIVSLEAEPTGAALSIEADTKGHDLHLAEAASWPVYSRSAVAVAFPASHAPIAVAPAEFRYTAARNPTAPLLIRH